MPRYYFDSSDGRELIRDEIGIELPDLMSARDEAINGLPDIARDKLPEGSNRAFTVRVRDGAGQYLLEAALKLSLVWLVEQP